MTLKRLAKDKHASLFCPAVSDEEKVLWQWHLVGVEAFGPPVRKGIKKFVHNVVKNPFGVDTLFLPCNGSIKYLFDTGILR
jgi:hypothetical protein